MKSNKVEKLPPKVNQDYPVLKRFQNFHVVLFTSPKTGVVVWSNYKSDFWARPVGEHREDWAEESFELFHGDIILSNE